MHEKDIKIPTNFSNEINVMELGARARELHDVKNKIIEYKDAFVESFFKTQDEVLKEIPYRYLTKYKLCDGYLDIVYKSIDENTRYGAIFNETSKNLEEVLIDNSLFDIEYAKKINFDFCKDKFSNLSIRDQMCILNPQNKKIFLADHKNKNIHIVFDDEKNATLLNDYCNVILTTNFGIQIRTYSTKITGFGYQSYNANVILNINHKFSLETNSYINCNNQNNKNKDNFLKEVEILQRGTIRY